jgi:hypothetical protein
MPKIATIANILLSLRHRPWFEELGWSDILLYFKYLMYQHDSLHGGFWNHQQVFIIIMGFLTVYQLSYKYTMWYNGIIILI